MPTTKRTVEPDAPECSASDAARDAEWDAFVASHPEGYHEQTSMYGRIREEYGFHVDRVVVREGGEICGGAQILVQQTPVGKYAQVLRGPLAAHNDREIMNNVIAELEQCANSHSYASLRIDTFPNQSLAQDVLAENGFAPSRAWFGVKRSLVVPVQYSDDELLARMKRGTRYNTRAAMRTGVEICLGSVSDVNVFYELYEMTALWHKFTMYPKEYFHRLMALLNDSGRLLLLVARYNNKPVGARFVSIVGNTGYAGWIGTHRGETERRLNAGDLLQYHAMRVIRDSKCDNYDLGGTEQYKWRFAQQQIEWPPPMRKFYGPGRALRRALLEKSSSNALLRRVVRKAIDRWKLRPRMPY